MQSERSSLFGESSAGDEMLRPAQVRAALGGSARPIGHSTLYDWIAVGLLPPPVRLSPRVVVWPRSVIEKVIAQRAAGTMPKIDRAKVRAARRAARDALSRVTA